MYRYDNRVVITLDAGGTNLVFGAMQANKFIVDPITLPSNADNLDKCLATMVEGFQAVIDKLNAMLDEVYADSEFTGYLKEMGYNLWDAKGDEVRTFIENQMDSMDRYVQLLESK